MRIVFTLASMMLAAACTIDQPQPAAKPAAHIAAAASAGGQPAAQPVAAKSDPDKKICRRVTMTGSNMPESVCATQAEWDARDKQAQEGNDQIDRARRSGANYGRGE